MPASYPPHPAPAQDAVDLRALIAGRKRGYSLPAPFYLSRDIFARDMDVIFGRQWLYVGVESQIPEPGDLFTVEIGSASIIIARDDDRAVRAFHNVCRHRGAQLRAAGSGSVGNLVCPYHQWTYNLRGELIHSQHMGKELERCRFNLKPVHVESLAGLLFICLAENPPQGFEAMRAAMQPYLAPHDVANCKVAFQRDIIEAGNWKLTMENNRECYHCVANHPELTVPLHEYGFGYQPPSDQLAQVKDFEDLLVREHTRWEACGLPSAEIEHLDQVTGFRAVRLPIAGSGESQTNDTKAASRKLLGQLTRADLGGLSFWTQPNSWHHFMSDHVVSFSVLPISAEKTLLRTQWLVHKDAQEGVDYDLERLTSVWIATNDQDSSLVERAHRGIGSPAYEPGPYSPFTEGLVEKFCEWYLDRLAAGLEPPASLSGTTAAASNSLPGASVATRGVSTNPERASRDGRVAANADVAGIGEVGGSTVIGGTAETGGSAEIAHTADISASNVPEALTFAVNFSKDGRTVTCRADQTLLEAGEAADLPLPFSCRQGMCGTCRSRLISGRVEMKHAGGIRQRQIDMGYILLCCSRPVTDVVIESPRVSPRVAPAEAGTA